MAWETKVGVAAKAEDMGHSPAGLDAGKGAQGCGREFSRFGNAKGPGLEAGTDFGFGQGVVGGFGEGVDAVDEFIGRWNVMPTQPKNNIRLPAHRPDVDGLF